MSQSFCTNCGAKAAEAQRFCGDCGKALSASQSVSEKNVRTVEVKIESLNGPSLRTNALLTYVSQVRTLKLADASLTVSPITVDFIEDTSARLSRCGKRTAQLRFRQRAVNSTSDLLIDFPDETSLEAVINAMARKRVSKNDQAVTPSGVRAPEGVRQSPQVASGSGVRSLGGFLLVVGLGIVAYFYFVFSTTVDVPAVTFGGQSFGGGEVNNLGLMNERMIGIVVGIGACLIGTLLWLFGGAKAKETA